MSALIDAAANYFRILPSDIIGPRRSRRMVKARAAVALVMFHRDDRSYSEIGRRIGGRDHSTIINCVGQGWRWMLKDPVFGDFVDAQLCASKFRAAQVASPYAEPFTMTPPKKRDAHLAPCPAHLIKLKPPKPPRETMEYNGKSFSVDENGFCNADADWRKGLSRASSALFAAMVREHPERFAA